MKSLCVDLGYRLPWNSIPRHCRCVPTMYVRHAHRPHCQSPANLRRMKIQTVGSYPMTYDIGHLWWFVPVHDRLNYHACHGPTYLTYCYRSKCCHLNYLLINLSYFVHLINHQSVLALAAAASPNIADRTRHIIRRSRERGTEEKKQNEKAEEKKTKKSNERVCAINIEAVINDQCETKLCLLPLLHQLMVAIMPADTASFQ